jgi:hypothetical protein
MREFTYISWLNNLGGFEYWPFVGYKDDLLSVEDTGETKKNLFHQWPKSYGSFADTVTKQTFRRTRKQKIIRSQNLSRTQLERIGEEIRNSVLVQIVTSRRDRRTVIVDNSSVTVRRGVDKIHSLSFTISYTDQVAGQTV